VHFIQIGKTGEKIMQTRSQLDKVNVRGIMERNWMDILTTMSKQTTAGLVRVHDDVWDAVGLEATHGRMDQMLRAELFGPNQQPTTAFYSATTALDSPYQFEWPPNTIRFRRKKTALPRQSL